MSPNLIIVEGPVNVGKSTLISGLKQKFSSSEENDGARKNVKICFLNEPIEKWTNHNGENILEKAIKGEKVLEFQIIVFGTLYEQLRDAMDDDYDVIVMERSLFSAYHIFTLGRANMSETEQKLAAFAFKKYPIIKADGVIFLNTDSCEPLFKRSDCCNFWIESIWKKYQKPDLFLDEKYFGPKICKLNGETLQLNKMVDLAQSFIFEVIGY